MTVEGIPPSRLALQVSAFTRIDGASRGTDPGTHRISRQVRSRTSDRRDWPSILRGRWAATSDAPEHRAVRRRLNCLRNEPLQGEASSPGRHRPLPARRSGAPAAGLVAALELIAALGLSSGSANEPRCSWPQHPAQRRLSREHSPSRRTRRSSPSCGCRSPGLRRPPCGADAAPPVGRPESRALDPRRHLLCAAAPTTPVTLRRERDAARLRSGATAARPSATGFPSLQARSTEAPDTSSWRESVPCGDRPEMSCSGGTWSSPMLGD